MANMSCMIAIDPLQRYDPFHRYLMPTPIFQNTGKNGGQVSLTNASIIAKSLARPLIELKQAISRGLGVSCQCKGDTLIFKLDNTIKFGEVLDDYIVKNILCRKCRNPETVNGRCRACGTKQ